MYGKLYESTFTGSMVGAGCDVFAVWGYVIAHCRAGIVELNPVLVAASLGCSRGSVDDALAYLQQPDEHSRSKEEDGRRLVKTGEFTFRVVNHKHYRNMRTPDDRREYMRQKQRESRARRKAAAEVSNANVNESTQTEAEAEAREGLSDPCQAALLPDEFLAATDYVQGVWDFFCQKRQEAYPDSKPLRFTAKRKGHIRARLKERERGVSERERAREMCKVVKAFFDPRFFWGAHSIKKPELVFRSAEQFEEVRDAKPYGQKVAPIKPPEDTRPDANADAAYQAQVAAERGPRKVGPPEGFDVEAARKKLEAELAAEALASC